MTLATGTPRYCIECNHHRKTKTCVICKSNFQVKYHPTNGAATCSELCRSTLVSQKLGGRQAWTQNRIEACIVGLKKSRKERPDFYKQIALNCSERMKNNNPASKEETREKISKAMQGKTFLARGGNGKLTEPQLLLQSLTGLELEYPIGTSGVIGFQSLPKCYRVDLASVKVKLAVEVDGDSHNTKLQKWIDKRKTAILEFLGWKVLRVSNKEVISSPEETTRYIMWTIQIMSSSMTLK